MGSLPFRQRSSAFPRIASGLPPVKFRFVFNRRKTEAIREEVAFVRAYLKPGRTGARPYPTDDGRRTTEDGGRRAELRGRPNNALQRCAKDSALSYFIRLAVIS
jgi:hypothetical protein